jgi:Hemerythrin HHE cation binding domain
MSCMDIPLADTRDMYLAHAMFRRQFGLMPTLVRAARSADLERVRIVADHFEPLNTVLVNHHFSEDRLLWPRLLNRAVRESVSVIEIMEIMEIMEIQHAALQELDDELVACVGAWRQTGSSALAETLADGLDTLDIMLSEHMLTKERQALPLVEKYITAAEWEEMGLAEARDIEPRLMPLILMLSKFIIPE